jgi:TATA-binding protein-associated factor Taf7
VGERELTGKLVDLPCVIETHKSFDPQNSTFFNSGNVGQMLIFRDPATSKRYRLALRSLVVRIGA